MSIEVAGVSKYFGKEKILSSLSFAAEEGKITGLLGPNGAGKSTLMNIITTYHTPSEGKVLVKGLNTQEEPLKVRKIVGYLPERNPLYEEMYVKEFLVFMGRLHGLSRAVLKRRMQEVLDTFGLGDKQHKKIQVLSKGYKQRVGLARAFLHNPQVLILDEPTVGLDPNQLREVRALIQEVAKEHTVLFSTHILQEAQAICDKVLVIHKGQKVMDETLSSLKSNELSGSRERLEDVFRRLTEPSTQSS